MCPKDSYISAMAMKLEGGQGDGDDTAANGFAIRCRKLDGTQAHEFKVANEGEWGGWQSWSTDYNTEFVCGGKYRSERDQGPDADDTAFNGLKIDLCKRVKE